jgi:hypothetical protein
MELELRLQKGLGLRARARVCVCVCVCVCRGGGYDDNTRDIDGSSFLDTLFLHSPASKIS